MRLGPLLSNNKDQQHNTWHTLKCLSIGTPKIINFPFVSNEKINDF